MIQIEQKPEAAVGSEKSAVLLDKRALAAILRLSTRSVSNLMEKGLPHLKIGERRVRFVQDDVLGWLKETYSCQRLGKLNRVTS